MSSKKHNYDESKIKTLSSLEHIRTRTGMYIGRLGDGAHYDDGIYVLLKEAVDNAVDEFIMGMAGKSKSLSMAILSGYAISGAASRRARGSNAFPASILAE